MDSSSVDVLTPLVKRRGSYKRCSRSMSLGNVDQQARQLNQSFKVGNRALRDFSDETIVEDYLARSDGLVISHSNMKYNKTFHKLFQNIPEEERLTHTFTCALQREVLYHGKLFVSENHLCFFSSVLLKETKVVIAFSSVTEIKKHNPTLSVLSVQTSSGEKYFFASLRNYTQCYGLLQSLCSQAQESSPNSSPCLSPAKFGAEPYVASSSSSLEESLEFGDVELSDSISLIHDEANGTCRSTQESGFTNENGRAASWIWSFLDNVMLFMFYREIRSLRVVVYIFVILLLLLLLASGYIGLRITALEEQLSALGVLTDLTLHNTEYQET